ncbi:hypothetical protein EAE96_003008 [Botrytis aclada]|nr:hypothetical protein EAE96_003008 [Botrytis aclada]
MGNGHVTADAHLLLSLGVALVEIRSHQIKEILLISLGSRRFSSSGLHQALHPGAFRSESAQLPNGRSGQRGKKVARAVWVDDHAREDPESVDETFGFAVSKASNLLSRHVGSGGERYHVHVEHLLHNRSNFFHIIAPKLSHGNTVSEHNVRVLKWVHGHDSIR